MVSPRFWMKWKRSGRQSIPAFHARPGAVGILPPPSRGSSSTRRKPDLGAGGAAHGGNAAVVAVGQFLQRRALHAASSGLFPLRRVRAGGRPICCPRALARLLPSAVRVRIRSRSTSARPPKTASIKRPVLVPVSAQGWQENGIALWRPRSA